MLLRRGMWWRLLAGVIVLSCCGLLLISSKSFVTTISAAADHHAGSLPKQQLMRKDVGRGCAKDFSKMEGNFVFLSIKSTAKYHLSRLTIQLQTWIPSALELRGTNNASLIKVATVSDEVDPIGNVILKGRMVKSRCANSHNRTDLCCKQATEFDLYFAEKVPPKWYCHFDDDNYVNVHNLLHLLRQHDHRQPLFFGKSSRGRTKLKDIISSIPGRSVTFKFATGGAGFCLSQAAMRIIKHRVSRALGRGGLEGVCRSIGLTDDVAVGYVAGFHNITLTEINEFHSHLEKLSALLSKEILEAISLSYTNYKSYLNTVNLPTTRLPKRSDPTRFLSLHAYLTANAC